VPTVVPTILLTVLLAVRPILGRQARCHRRADALVEQSVLTAVTLRGMLDARCADIGAQGLELAATGCLNEFVEHSVICNQPFAPVFGKVHGVDFVAMGPLAPIQEQLNWLWVDLAHELADELHLTPSPFVGAGVSHFDNGIGQAFGEFERAQHRSWQLNQLGAEFLERCHVALALRLTGPVVLKRFLATGGLRIDEARIVDRACDPSGVQGRGVGREVIVLGRVGSRSWSRS
jgi:hypothetical protein